MVWLDHDSWRLGFWAWFGLGWLRPCGTQSGAPNQSPQPENSTTEDPPSNALGLVFGWRFA